MWPSHGLYHYQHTDRSLLLLHLLLNTQLDRQDCCIERSHCEAVPRSNAWLPIVREPFFSKHRLEIINAATEDGEHRRRAWRMSVAHHTKARQVGTALTSHFQTYCGINSLSSEHSQPSPHSSFSPTARSSPVLSKFSLRHHLRMPIIRLQGSDLVFLGQAQSPSPSSSNSHHAQWHFAC